MQKVMLVTVGNINKNMKSCPSKVSTKQSSKAGLSLCILSHRQC